MPILEWKENFNLGIERIDTRHRHMVELLNYAYDKYVEDSSVDALTATLQELFDYAIYHFKVEEQYMAENNYTDYAEHLESRRVFSAQVSVMQKDLIAMWENLPLEMLAFLKNWLTYDILIADADYARFNSENQWKKCA